MLKSPKPFERTMAHLQRVKRRVLREAVRENLDTIRGLPPRPLRQSQRLWRVARRGLLLVAVPSLAFAVGNTHWTGGGERRTGAPAASLTAASMPTAFPAPRPIDPAAFSLGVKKIVLDPGHGGTDSGARTRGGLWEKVLTLDVAHRLRDLLTEAAFDVSMTRDRDEFVSLRQRAAFANAERADLFVSIHVNSIPTPDCRAVETYYLGPADDPHAARLAGAENRESGYSMADFRRLLEGVYAHVRQAESKRLARVVQSELVVQLGRANPAIHDNGVKSAPFLVLVATESPGILAEVSCLSNDEEAQWLADPDYPQKTARGLFLGIRAYAEARTRSGRQESS